MDNSEYLLSMANISKILCLILSYVIVKFCKAYSSMFFLCCNKAILTIHTKILAKSYKCFKIGWPSDK